MFRGFAAIIEAYLIYWAIVYFVARKWFGFSREWAAPLASGISICGVSAAIATAAAIRARPMAAVMVSSLVVIFAMVLPGINLITSGNNYGGTRWAKPRQNASKRRALGAKEFHWLSIYEYTP
jgi:hypothetical protein